MNPLHRLSAFAVAALFASPVLAGLGEGITTGRLTLRPYIEGSVGYDSNADRRLDYPTREELDAARETDPEAEVPPKVIEDSDTYYELRGGVNFVWYDELTVLRGGGYASTRTYADLDVEDEQAFGQNLALARGDRESLSWSVFESYVRRFDYFLAVPELEEGPEGEVAPPPTDTGDIDLEDELVRTRDQRDIFDVGINAGRKLTEKMEFDAGYSYSQTDYEEDIYYGRSRHGGTASLGRQVTVKTSTFVTGAYGEENNDRYLDPVPYYQLMAGLRSRTSEKLFYNLGVGYHSYDTAHYKPYELEDGTLVYEDRSRLLPDGTFEPAEPRRNPVTEEIIEEQDPSDTQSGMAYDAGIRYQPSPKLGFQASARNSYDSISSGDQREVNLFQLSATYRPTAAIAVSLRAGYRDEESVNETILVDDEGLVSRLNATREITTAGGRISYRPVGKWYEFFTDATYQDISSNLDYQSYDRLRVGAGVRATY